MTHQLNTNSLSDDREPACGPGNNVVLPGQTPTGEPILSVLLKRSYDIVPDGVCRRAMQDFKIIAGDVHYQDPMNSTVRYEADFIPYKPHTDVVFNGNAYAPAGELVPELTACLAVGQFEKSVRVIGHRVVRCDNGDRPSFSEPEPFSIMPLRYENAYGGVDIRSDPDMPCPYPRNHLGKGYVIGKEKNQVDGLELPNIEDPADLLTPERLSCGHFMHWADQPKPQGFGWYMKFWRPRADLAGVMPADRALERQLREAYTPLVPREQQALYAQTQLPDMDFRFFNGASEGLVLPYLKGNEQIRLVNLAPRPEITFQLPGDAPRIGLDIGDGFKEPQACLHTVMIRMEENQIDLVWRAAVPYAGPDWLPHMQKMEVKIQ
jgi:hypothetical protein